VVIFVLTDFNVTGQRVKNSSNSRFFVCFQEISGEYPDHEIHQRCQSVMSYPGKMKRAWIEKSCQTILSSSEVKKLSVNDLAGIETDPQVSKFLKRISEIAKRNEKVLADSAAFKRLLLLTLTSHQLEDERSSNKFDNLKFVYMKMFSMQKCFLNQKQNDFNHFLQVLHNVFKPIYN
jgi:hypothetical protein